jgi:DNA repair protein RecN (Recombination protein N)
MPDRDSDRADAQALAGVTAADVRVVEGDQRIAELARMLGGSASATALRHAAELLRTAATDPAAEPAAAQEVDPAVPAGAARRRAKPVKTDS